MLSIRQGGLEAIKRATISHEKAFILRRYQEISPTRMADLGPRQASAFVDHVFIEARDEMQLRSLRDVAYVGFVMQLCGSWFHRDPMYRCLSNGLWTLPQDETDLRVTRLYRKVQEHRDSCWGRDLSIILRATRDLAAEISQISQEDRIAVLKPADAISLLKKHHPERVEIVPARDRHDFLEESALVARRNGFCEEGEVTVIALLGLLFGLHFLTDPLLTSAWLDDSFKNTSRVLPIRTLVSSWLAFLKSSLNSLEQ